MPFLDIVARPDPHGRGGLRRPRAADPLHRRRRPRRRAGRRGHAARRRAQRAAAEHRRPRLPRRASGGRRGRARRCAATGADLVVEVIDDGAGLPEGSTSTRPAGLGLSIVRTLVTLRARRHDRAGPSAAVGPRARCVQHPGARRARHRAAIGARTRNGPRRAPGAAGGAVERSGSAGAALAGEPGPAELAALLLGGAAPDAGVLVGDAGRTRGRRAWASQVRHTALAWAICSMAGPVVPTGKNRSGLVSRQAASSRQSSFSTDVVGLGGEGEGHLVLRGVSRR